MSEQLRWLIPCLPARRSARPVDSPSNPGVELRGRIDPVPTTDPEPSVHDESPANTEPALHGSVSALPNSGAEPSGIVAIAPNVASHLDHVDAPPNPIPKPDGAGTASPNPTPELSDPTGSATVVAPEPHSPVDVASTAVPDPSQSVSVAPTPEPGLVSAIDSAQDPTPELDPSVDSSTIHESPAKPTGRFSLSDGQKAFVKSIGKTTLAAAKAASTAVPTLAIVVGCLEFVVSVAEKYGANVDSMKALEDHMKKIQELTLTMSSEAKVQHHQQTLEKTLLDAGKALEPIKDQNWLIKALTTSEITSRIEEYVKKVDQALVVYQISMLQHMLDMSLQQLTYDETNILDKLPRSKDAGFNAASGHDRRGCLPGTRVEVLATLKDWALNGTKQVYWLNGHAGSGKSTIAHSFAQWLFQEQMLGASFFCSRNSTERRDRALIFPTIAYQLATSLNAASLDYRRDVINALKKNLDVGYLLPRNQMEELLVRPVVASSMQTIIVLDALDECEDSESTSIILSVIADFIDHIPLLKFFITSRPEPRIQRGFRPDALGKVTRPMLMHEIDSTEVHNDLRLFVKVELTRVKQVRSEIAFPVVWPQEDEVETLAASAAGLFIFAATVIKSIENTPGNPCTQLNIIADSLKSAGSHGDTDIHPFGVRKGRTKPYAELDALYLRILQDAFSKDEDIADARDILALLVVAHDSLCLETIAGLLPDELFVDASDVKPILLALQSVLYVPDKAADPIQFYHKSFPDFLTDSTRCKDPRIIIDPNHYHFTVAQRCFQIMKEKLKKNICGLPRYSKNEELSPASRDNRIHETTRYSCRYWAIHVLADNDRESAQHFDALEPLLFNFLYAQLLHWFEVLGILLELRKAVEGLNDVHAWVASFDDPRCQSLVIALVDGQRFVLNAFDTIQESVAHMYHSHLPFSPSASIFANGHYLRDHAGEAKVLVGVNDEWSPDIRSIHAEEVYHVLEYSHDGTMLAAGARDIVDVFRAATGERMAKFCCAEPGMRTVLFSFSTDDRILAVAEDLRWSSAFRRRYDRCIALWDIATGTKLMVLPCIHRDPISAIAYDPANSEQLLSVDESGLLAVWNTSDSNTEVTELHQMFRLSGVDTNCAVSWIPGPTYRNTILVGFHNNRIEMRDIVADPKRCLRVFWADRDGDFNIDKVIRITVPGNGGWFASHTGCRVTVHNIETAEVVISFPVPRVCTVDSAYLFVSTSSNTANPMLAFGDREAVSLSFISHGTNDSDSQRINSGLFRLQPEPYTTGRFYFQAIALSPNGRSIASSCGAYGGHVLHETQGIIKVCDTLALASPLHVTGHENYIGNITLPHFSPDGRFIVFPVSSEKSTQAIAVWTVAGIAASCQFEIINCHELRDMGRIVDVVFLSDSRYIVSVDHRGVMDLWDWRQKQILHTDRTAQIYELSKTCTTETKYTLFPFTDGPPGFSLTYCTAAKDGGGICCWLVETNPPGLKLLVNGRLPIGPTRFANPPPSTGRNPAARIAFKFEDEPLRIYRHGQIPDGQNTSPSSLAELVVEYKSTRQFSTPCEWGYELEWVEFDNSYSQSEACSSPYDQWTCVGPEIPILLSSNEDYIMNKYGKKLFLVPPAHRGPGRWHGKKALLWASRWRLTLLDFSQVNIDEAGDVLF